MTHCENCGSVISVTEDKVKEELETQCSCEISNVKIPMKFEPTFTKVEIP